MCGADDCPRCHPGCDETFECAVCGTEVYKIHAVPCDICGEYWACEHCKGTYACPMCTQKETCKPDEGVDDKGEWLPGYPDKLRRDPVRIPVYKCHENACEILKDGHTMFFIDIIRELNEGARTRYEYEELCRKVDHGCTDANCYKCDNNFKK